MLAAGGRSACFASHVPGWALPYVQQDSVHLCRRRPLLRRMPCMGVVVAVMLVVPLAGSCLLYSMSVHISQTHWSACCTRALHVLSAWPLVMLRLIIVCSQGLGARKFDSERCEHSGTCVAVRVARQGRVLADAPVTSVGSGSAEG